MYEDSGHQSFTTNNRMELLAIVKALERVKTMRGFNPHMEILIKSDSTYCIQGATKWMHGWASRDWVTAAGKEVANKEIWQSLRETSKQMPFVRYEKVTGHSGEPGNERVDELAVRESRNLQVDPFRGRIEDSIFSSCLQQIGLEPEEKTLEHNSKNGKFDQKSLTPNKTQAYYFCQINGAHFRYTSWPECKAAVEGVSGAKYKKVKSINEELECLRIWGKKT